MAVRVLVVDDSAFFRQRISEILSQSPNITVVGTARDGLDAIEKNNELKPDVITMDVEMPKLNGVDAVRQIMRERPTQVLMVSSLTHEGAQITLQAMEAGAVDYLTKDMRAWMDKSQSLNDDLISRIVALGKSKHFVKSSLINRFSALPKTNKATSSARVFRSQEEVKTAAPVRAIRQAAKPLQPARCRVVVIGSSTGGPAALQTILTELPANFPHPILLVQHMPNTFTSVFAERLNQQCAIEVKHAESGDKLKPGRALLAPGGQQMILDGTHSVQVLKGDERLTYRPSVDVTFASVAKHFSSQALAIVLTGMGADGRDGAKLLKSAGAIVWTQSEDSCTIYGMPQAVVKAGAGDSVVDLKDFATFMCANRA
ncbi:MAG: chemotaxis response regulator protein-glutamate methylesterase [Pseudomonadales bacterium]|nr:chemotaxis response regulator protein-glutamate methylesterase [Pseudomonadales bacterium]NRA17319.1 chemotaxis response regulator protein-glutamate methylesterase [Oceanospirillaceae bacterium]